MPETFGEYLRDRIKAAQLTPADFAKRVGLKSRGNLGDILTGVNSPPPEVLDRWADILGLRGEEQDRFFELALIRHLPAELRAYAEGIFSRLKRLERLLPPER
jgi:transcriptional regulator with XRE-family HTH domain